MAFSYVLKYVVFTKEFVFFCNSPSLLQTFILFCILKEQYHLKIPSFSELAIGTYICYTIIHEVVRCIRFSSRERGDQHECIRSVVLDDSVCYINRVDYFNT